MDKLHLLRLLMTVVDQGSFANAAGFLGLSPSTVSKAISRLEDDLGVVLFYRTTRQLTLTEAGQHYLKTVRHVVSDLDLCEQAITTKNDQPKGKLTLNVPISYGRRYILPFISEFNQRYPEIEVNISFDDAYVDMIEKGIDVCIRSGTLDDSSLIAKQLSPIDFLICASPDYLQQAGNIPLTAFDQHPWIRFRFRQTGKLMPIMVPEEGDVGYLDPGKEFIVDDGEALADLCAQGVGLTQMPHFIAKDWIDAGQIVPIFPMIRPKGFGVWVIYHKREFLPEKIRVFVEFLQEKVQALGETPYATWAERFE